MTPDSRIRNHASRRFTHLPLGEQVAAQVLARQAGAIGERPFVVFGDRSVTYAEASRRADRVAHAFHALGVEKGMRVAILLRNRLEYLDLWFGLSRLRAVQVPINTEYKRAQILHVLRRAPAPFVVVEQSLAGELLAVIDEVADVNALIVLDADTLAGTQKKVLSYRRCLDAVGELRPFATEVAGYDLGAVMNTSGTTGPSKGVQLSHAQQYILGRNITLDLDLSEEDVYYNFFPLFHNTAQAMITLPVLLAGARMVLIEKFSATRFWKDVQEYRCTTFYYIGEILRILLKSTPADEGRGTSLRAGWGIGASAKDFVEFEKRYGVRLHAGYGSTEANVPVYLPHENPNPTTVGRVIPGFQLRIANERDEPLPAGQMGEILVRSDDPCAIMLGYDGNANATLEAWRDLWFHTGDAGYLDADGNLYFTGRVRDVMRVRGENVSAFEVEEAIAEVNGVVEVAAIGVPCELGGDDIKIVVVTRPDAKIAAATLIAYAQARLPKFAVPRYVEFVEALPKTETNKVRKNVLRAMPIGAATWDRLKAVNRDP